jgi:hypothetical protein
MGKVVETSFHHINGKHGRDSREGHIFIRKFPVIDSLVNPVLI